MIKLTFFVRRDPSWSFEAFDEYWRTHHGALIKKHAAAFGIRRYVQVHAADHPRNAPSQAFPEPYDGLAELWFEDRAALDLWFDNATPETRAAGKEIRADERKFIDRSNSPFLIGEEVPVIA